jgi:hypothetical protein
MQKLMLALVLLVGVSQSGCAFLGGAALGALGTSAGYEINAKSKMDQLEDDYKAERISRAEYLSRKSQLEKGSIVY